MKKQKLLPPLDYLLAFEAAANHGSFAAAARHLNISETSISRKVRLLELHYDVALFVRGHRSITLTPQGHSLLTPVREALDALRSASQDVLAQQQKNAVHLAATNSVAALWLMPRLRRFNRANPRVQIMLLASDEDEECLADTIDLAILRGDGNWPGYRAQQLFGETVFPVCAPSYLRTRPQAGDLSGLPDLDLIEVSNKHTEWMSWPSFLSAQGLAGTKVTSATHVNTYPLAIQAAADGMGIALGWGHLVDRMLDDGTLVRPLGDRCVRTQSGYYLLEREGQKSFPERDIVEKWLLSESAARKRYGLRGSLGATGTAQGQSGRARA